jgi:hypothetical protein
MIYVKSRAKKNSQNYAYWYQYSLRENLKLIHIHQNSGKEMVDFLMQPQITQTSAYREQCDRKGKGRRPFSLDSRGMVRRNSLTNCDKAWAATFCEIVVRLGYHGYIADKLYWSTEPRTGKKDKTSFHEETMVCYPGYWLNPDWYAKEDLNA